MHVLINLTWKCQLKCPYCLIPHIKINRDAVEHTWQEWAEGIERNVPSGSVVDVAGGEPTLFPGLGYFLKELALHGIRWAITTNAVSKRGVKSLIEIHPDGCVLVNVSDHPGNADCDDNINKLEAVFPLNMNRVDHPDAGKRTERTIHNIIPYQRYAEGTELDGIRRWCNSGRWHWVADPGGDVFRCNPHMACGLKPIGNLFAPEPIVKPEPIICEMGCSSCYTSVPDAWQVNMKRV